MRHHPADLALGEVPAEAEAQIGHRVGSPEHLWRTGPISADQAPGESRVEERVGAGQCFDLRLGPIDREVAAGQWGAGGPIRTHARKVVLQLGEHALRQAAVGGNLAAEDVDQGRATILVG